MLAICLILFVAGQLLLALYLSKKLKNRDGFFLGGRQLGLGISSIALAATWFGAESCISAAGEARQEGVHLALAEPFGYGIGMALFGWIFARRFRERELSTLPEWFAEIFGSKTEKLSAILLIPTSVLWASAQLRATAQLSAGLLGQPYLLCLISAGVLVILYTMIGGLLADTLTDVVQGILLCLGLLALFFAVIRQPETSIHTLSIRWFPEHSNLKLAETMAVPILGSLVAQELFLRSMATKSASVARRACLYGALLYIFFGLIPIMLGSLSPGVFPLGSGAIETESIILQELTRFHFGRVGEFFFASVLLCAVLSTIDTALLVSAGLFTQNVAPKRFSNLTFSRLAVILSGSVALLLAAGNSTIRELVEEAASFSSTGALILLLISLAPRTDKFKNRFSDNRACYLLIVGCVSYIILKHHIAIEAPFLSSLVIVILAATTMALSPRRAPTN